MTGKNIRLVSLKLEHVLISYQKQAGLSNVMRTQGMILIHSEYSLCFHNAKCSIPTAIVGKKTALLLCNLWQRGLMLIKTTTTS